MPTPFGVLGSLPCLFLFGLLGFSPVSFSLLLRCPLLLLLGTSPVCFFSCCGSRQSNAFLFLGSPVVLFFNPLPFLHVLLMTFLGLADLTSSSLRAAWAAPTATRLKMSARSRHQTDHDVPGTNLKLVQISYIYAATSCDEIGLLSASLEHHLSLNFGFLLMSRKSPLRHQIS